MFFAWIIILAFNMPLSLTKEAAEWILNFALLKFAVSLSSIMGISIMSSVIPLEAGHCNAGPVGDLQLSGLGADCFLKVFF